MSPSSLLPLSVISDLTLTGLVRSDSLSELGPDSGNEPWPDTLGLTTSGDRDMMSSSVRVMESGCNEEDIFGADVNGDGLTNLAGRIEELVMVELSDLLSRGVNIIVWDTGRFSGVELSNERKV